MMFVDPCKIGIHLKQKEFYSDFKLKKNRLQVYMSKISALMSND